MSIRGIPGKLIRKATNLLGNSRLHVSSSSKLLFVELRQDVRLRTIETVIIPFRAAGYDVVLKAGFNRQTLIRASLPTDHCPIGFAWFPARPQATTIYCTDDESLARSGMPHRKQILLDYQKSAAVNPEEFDVWFPLMMHPHIYLRGGAELQSEPTAETDRPVRVLFAGNYGEGYDLPGFTALYGVPTRNEVVAGLESLESLEVIDSAACWEGYLDTQTRPGVVMFDPGFRVWQNRWVRTLSKCDFFVCPPGLLYPPCHNAYEAIAAGAIPVICYNDWFVPPLVDGEHCLQYRSVDELRQCVSRALAMDQGHVCEMRRRLQAFHDRHLSQRSVVNRILNCESPIVKVRVVDETQMIAGLKLFERS
jgi:hypothetical protein